MTGVQGDLPVGYGDWLADLKGKNPPGPVAGVVLTHASVAPHGEAEESTPSSMWTIRVFASLSFSPRSPRKAVSLGTT